jgi:hypothetical protein
MVATTTRDDAPVKPEGRYKRRLSDKILIAFHLACDQGDVESAWLLLEVLEFMAWRPPTAPNEIDRRAKESLVAAHNRLWHIRRLGGAVEQDGAASSLMYDASDTSDRPGAPSRASQIV